MKTFKIYLKYIFTINNDECKNLKLHEHIIIRILMFICMIPFLYVIFFSYLLESFTIYNIFRTILFALITRVIAKKPIDMIINIFLKKSSYKIDNSIKYTRKRKLQKLKFKKILKL